MPLSIKGCHERNQKKGVVNIRVNKSARQNLIPRDSVPQNRVVLANRFDDESGKNGVSTLQLAMSSEFSWDTCGLIVSTSLQLT